jgi:hypothetical protein
MEQTKNIKKTSETPVRCNVHSQTCTLPAGQLPTPFLQASNFTPKRLLPRPLELFMDHLHSFSQPLLGLQLHG